MSSATRVLFAAVMAVGSLSVVGCKTSPPETAQEQHALRTDAQAALEKMYDRDPSLKGFVDKSYAYAIFPSVGKGGLIAGGGGGRGEVFQQGRFIGYAGVSQVTVGLQAGGQEYSELIAFQDEPAFAKFRDGQEYSFTADASAIAVKAGGGSQGQFEKGVAVFVLPQGGLMAEASIGGQKFRFHPANDAEMAAYRQGKSTYTKTTTETRTNP